MITLRFPIPNPALEATFLHRAMCQSSLRQQVGTKVPAQEACLMMRRRGRLSRVAWYRSYPSRFGGDEKIIQPKIAQGVAIPTVVLLYYVCAPTWV